MDFFVFVNAEYWKEKMKLNLICFDIKKMPSKILLNKKMYIKSFVMTKKKEYNEGKISRRWIMLEVRNLEKILVPNKSCLELTFKLSLEEF